MCPQSESEEKMRLESGDECGLEKEKLWSELDKMIERRVMIGTDFTDDFDAGIYCI